MKTQMQREEELISSGLVDSVKNLFQNYNVNISEKYYILLADYVDSIGQLDFEDGLYLDPVQIARKLPSVLTEVAENNIGGIYGRTDGTKITMNPNLDYLTNKKYFFHELTHALQTRKVDNHEECSFYNGQTGMFLTEGATQFTAEILANISNGTNMQYRQQPNTVRGHIEHTLYSPLSEYQLNGNILLLLSKSVNLPINQILALGFRSDGRKMLGEMYEAFPGKQGKFEEFMLDLEKIYTIDKLLIAGYGSQLQGDPVNIEMQNGYKFAGNIKLQGDLINKVERNLAADFIANNDTDYIIQNYRQVASYLTTPELKQDFILAVNEVILAQNEQMAQELSTQEPFNNQPKINTEEITPSQFSKKTQDLIDEAEEFMKRSTQEQVISQYPNDNYDSIIAILQNPDLTDEQKTALLSEISNSPNGYVGGKSR